MLNKSYCQYLIMFICFSFLLGVKENQAAEREVMKEGSIYQSKAKKYISPDEKKQLLQDLLKGKNLPMSVKASEVIGIIGKKEPEKVEVLKELSPLEQDLSKELRSIEQKLNSSAYVSDGDLKRITTDLYSSVLEKLKRLSQEIEINFLYNKVEALSKQLDVFTKVSGLEKFINVQINQKNITNYVIDDAENRLIDIKNRAQFLQTASFNKRIIELEQLLKQQKELLALSAENLAELSKVERYLTFLENALKKDDIKPETVKNIKMSLDEMIGPQKRPKFSDILQSQIDKRVSTLKKLLNLLDNVNIMEESLKQAELSSDAVLKITHKVKSLEEGFTQLPLKEDLSLNAHKHIAKINNQLVAKLLEFLDQLLEASEKISTVEKLGELKKEFNILLLLRDNLNLTKDQERNINQRLVEIEYLLQQYPLLLEQQRQDQELKQEQQIRLVGLKEAKQKMEQSLETDQQTKELQLKSENKQDEGSANPKKEELTKTEEPIKKITRRKETIEQVKKEIEPLVLKFKRSIDDWRKVQDQEVRLRLSYMALQRRTTAKEQRTLKVLEEILERKKNFMTLYIDGVNAIHRKITKLYTENEKINFDNGDLIPLLNSWMSVLWDLRKQIVKDKHMLITETNQKKSEQKSFSIPFINRNEFVIKGLEELILLIDRMRIADDNKLVLIERAIQERNRPKKASKPKQQGAFSQYF